MHTTQPINSDPIAKDIFEFSSFGAFLRFRIESAHGARHKVSYRSFARRTKGVSPQMLHAIAHGKRLPSQNAMHQLCRALNLSYTQEQYAEALVGFEKADSTLERSSWAQKLAYFSRDKSNTQVASQDMDLFADPRYAAVFEMLDLEDFKADPAWLANRLSIPTSPDEARQILTNLKKIGMIEVVNGKLKKSSIDVASTKGTPSDSVKDFHSQFLQIADKALKNQSTDERDFFGVTMAINPELLPEARRLISKFSMELTTLLNVDPKAEVYHLAVQLFRVTEPKSPKNV